MQFEERTERRLNQGPNSAIAGAIQKDRKRVEEIRKNLNKGMVLNPADFTDFMVTHHDQKQE